MPFNLPALILTAGLGTRLRPLTDVRAKAAMPVAGEPLIRRSVRWLATHGVTDVVLNLHHRPETIAATMGDGSDLGARALFMGTAGHPGRRRRPAPGAVDRRRRHVFPDQR